MKITFVQFIVDIPGLGTYWSADKHASEWAIVEKGSWIVLTSNKNGQVRRAPVTSVACISEVESEVEAPKARTKAAA